MASVHARKNKRGEITSWAVRWRLGGSAGAPGQLEAFADEDSAKVFKKAVDEAGQRWPLGWVKGQGYIDPAAEDEDSERYRFEAYARASLASRTGIEERYRQASVRELETYILPTFGACDVRSPEHFSKATVGAWVLRMAQTRVWRGSKQKVMSPKTLRNLHGLLSSVLKEAVEAEPPLRERNPCDLTKLPRTDDDGITDEEDDAEDMCFLTPEEVRGFASCFAREEDRRLVRVTYGTGMRWGEVTALARRHAVAEPKRKLRIRRAWKWSPAKSHYLGTPKTKCSRREISTPPKVWADLVAQGLDELSSNALIFDNGRGERLRYSSFYDRWIAARALAHEKGLLPDYKMPTFHDLRHSYAALLISRGHSLTYVQRKLGHESIKTTSDRYGHLLPEADDDAMETLDEALGDDGTGGAAVPEENEPVTDPGRSVWVAHLGGRPVGFWRVEDAEETAERWARERGGAVHVERWTESWWRRMVGNGVKAVRRGAPARVLVWEIGPAVYGVDGAERAVPREGHRARAVWRFEFEEGFTDELACAAAEWRPGSAVETEARAWGTSREGVEEAFAAARTDALRICGLNPARAASEGREGASTA